MQGGPRDEVEIIWVALGEDNRAELPRGAHVVSIDYVDRGGLGSQRTAVGVWVAVYRSYL